MAKTATFEQHVDQYEHWFDRHRFVYESEIEAVRRLLPSSGNGLEVGVGTGRFAVPLGIQHGVEPAEAMRTVAIERGVGAIDGVAENLPFPPSTFDFVLMVTTICFVDDVAASLSESARILRPDGVVLIGFVDKDSFLGRQYEIEKTNNVFYREASFVSVREVVDDLRKAGFSRFDYVQTIFRELASILEVEPIREGYGDGAFVVIRAGRR